MLSSVRRATAFLTRSPLRYVTLPAPTSPPSSRIESEWLQRVLIEQVPLIGSYGVTVEHLAYGHCTVHIPFHDSFLRPGGSVTGPLMFGLADVALFGAVMSCIGPQTLTVTTSMSINFLRKPAPACVFADARILKLGARLAYGDIRVFSGTMHSDPVAHCTGTYAIPSKRAGGCPTTQHERQPPQQQSQQPSHQHHQQ
eukprot:EC716531.1.p1 GENE.EC716531.1~~EC716531.1.p1  ORF type:complete len:198 (+),score=22.98 EC716531.1:82-675(+)